MAEYSREEAQHASRIVDRLFAREADGLDLPEDVVVSDVETDARTFGNEMNLLAELDAKVPAAKVGDDVVPVSLALVLGRYDGLLPPFEFDLDGITWRRRYWRYRDFHEVLGHLLCGKRDLNGFVKISRAEAKGTFLRRASSFVATRFASVREFRDQKKRHSWHRPSFLNLPQWVNGPQVVTPGCHFTVSTNSSGLRVFRSGAYYVSSNYFNHPTSPTSSVLQAGSYIFGVDGGAYGNVIHWDYGAVVSLPGQPYVHLNF